MGFNQPNMAEFGRYREDEIFFAIAAILGFLRAGC